jgi:hypothetical protein
VEAYRHYIVEAQGHQIRVSYKEHRAAGKVAKKCLVPLEDLLVFFNLPACAIVMPTAALKLLEGLDLDVNISGARKCVTAIESGCSTVRVRCIANKFDFVGNRYEYSKLFLLLRCLSVPEASKTGHLRRSQT